MTGQGLATPAAPRDTIGLVYYICHYWDMYIGMLLVFMGFFYKKKIIAFNLHPALESYSRDIMPKTARLHPARIPLNVDIDVDVTPCHLGEADCGPYVWERQTVTPALSCPVVYLVKP